MPAPVYKNVIVSSSRPRRPAPDGHAIKDGSWMILGMAALATCGLAGAFLLGRVTSGNTGVPAAANIALAPPPPSTPSPVIRRAYAPFRTASAPASSNPDYVAPRVMAAVPAPPPVASVPMPTPVDYAAKDRRIHDLQREIDDIDEQILHLRSHPDSIPLLGTYNGRGYRVGEESPFKKLLDQLDKRRNDLRREKWRLEGR